MSARDPSAGFTLVETLASLTVMALLSLMLAAGVQFVRLQLSRIADLGSGQPVEAAQGLLRQRLRRAFPLLTASQAIQFDGRPDQISFIAPPEDAKGPDGLQHFALSVATDGTLRMTVISDLSTDSGAADRSIALLRGVRGLDIAYFGVTPPDLRPRWRERWQQQPNLPGLVRIRVTFPPRDGRLWPDLVIDPAATLDTACAIEPNTGTCRGRT